MPVAGATRIPTHWLRAAAAPGGLYRGGDTPDLSVIGGREQQFQKAVDEARSMQSVSPAIQRIACDEPTHGRPQAASPSWTSPSKARLFCFWPTRISARHVSCSSVAYPTQASFEVCPDKANLLDSLVASCVLYLLSYRLSV